MTLISSLTGINYSANYSIYSSVITFSHPVGTNGGLSSLLTIFSFKIFLSKKIKTQSKF